MFDVWFSIIHKNRTKKTQLFWFYICDFQHSSDALKNYQQIIWRFSWTLHCVLFCCCLTFSFFIYATMLVVGSVRWKKYINCGNRDKSTKLGTNVQHSILMKNFNGHTCEMSRDCWCQHFLTKNISIPKPIILYTIRKIIWCWTTFLLTPSYENVFNKSKWRVNFEKWRHHIWWFCMKILYFSKHIT